MIRTVAQLVLWAMIVSSTVFADEVHKHGPHRHMRYAGMKNPVRMTAESIAEGRTVYEKHCIACHGEAGKGGIGARLSAPTLIHGTSDGEIFDVIAAGVAGTAMKGFKKELSEKSRWNLVNYIKSLKKADK